MKLATCYLSLEEALELHRALIEQFGRTHGIRDLGLVESALHRPQSGYYESLSAQAAALFQSFLLNHAFIDGNKRIAFAAAAIFLNMNGYRLEVLANEGERFIVQQAIQNKADLETISKWFESWMRKKN